MSIVPSAGDLIARYRIVEEIGRGAMGAVYKAEDVYLGRLVALKVIAADKMPDYEAKARFDREVRAVSAVSHPNTARLRLLSAR